MAGLAVWLLESDKMGALHAPAAALRHVLSDRLAVLGTPRLARPAGPAMRTDRSMLGEKKVA